MLALRFSRFVLSFVLVISLPFSLYAQTVNEPLNVESVSEPLIAGPGVGTDDLQAYAQVHHRTTISESLEDARPLANDRARLSLLVEKAQTRWLAGQTRDARVTFQAVTELALEADWKNEQREAIQYAFLRLAQTAANENERSDWLNKGARLTCDLRPDGELFPPPLLSEWKQICARTHENSKAVVLGEAYQNFRTILIDGRASDIHPLAEILVTPGVHRVTLLSDALITQTAELDVQKISPFHPEQIPWIRGSCQTPTLEPVASNEKSAGEKFSVLFSHECVRNFADGKWLDPLAMKNLGVAPVMDPSQQIPAGTHGPWENEMHKPNNTWLWIALAGVAAAVVVHEQNSHHDSPPATTSSVHHSGF